MTLITGSNSCYDKMRQRSPVCRILLVSIHCTGYYSEVSYSISVIKLRIQSPSAIQTLIIVQITLNLLYLSYLFETVLLAVCLIKLILCLLYFSCILLH